MIRKAVAAKKIKVAQVEKPKKGKVGNRWPEAGSWKLRTCSLDVVNNNNEKIGSVDIRDEVFGGRVNTDLIWESVVRTNAAKRRGTHATKNRALVSGSGKKPWRQKGTGRARVGDIRTPLWRHGGTVFGPQPRSYEYQLPKKVELGALRAALAQKIRDGALVVVDQFAPETKTKAAMEMLKRLGVDGKTVLVDVAPDEGLTRSVSKYYRCRARSERRADCT